MDMHTPRRRPNHNVHPPNARGLHVVHLLSCAMAVRMLGKPHARAACIALRAAAESHARGAVRRTRAHPKQVMTQRRTVHESVVPCRRHGRQLLAPPPARQVQWPLVVQMQPLQRLARVPVPITVPIPVPAQIHRRRVRARRAVERAHAAQHAGRGHKCPKPGRLVVRVCMRHKVVPQRRTQVRPHLPREAGRWRAYEGAPTLRGAPLREARGCGVFEGGGWGRRRQRQQRRWGRR